MPTMQITSKTRGEKKEIEFLQDFGKRATNMKPIMEEIFADMLESEAALFRSQGRRGGGSWAKLAESTVRQKGHDSILYDKGYLMDSVTVRDARFQVKEITSHSVGLGTKRPKWYVHQYGSNRVPKREFIRFTEFDIQRWTKMIGDYVSNGKSFGRRGRMSG